jgi:small subunit ribosomal protein S8e
MALSQDRPKRKRTGGKYQKRRDKKRRYLAGTPVKTTIDEQAKRKIVGVRGGNKKVKIRVADVVNVIVDGKHKKAKIVKVAFSPANKHYVRLGIITRKAVVETDAGYVRVTSRPGQQGAIHGVLLTKAESTEIESLKAKKSK